MTASRASQEGAADVPLALLDDLLNSVASALHDRPVQSLVAARLLLETALAPSQGDEMLDRGLGAISAAGEQARDIMWALGGVSVRPGHIAVDVRDAVSRLAAPGAAVDVAVDVDDGVAVGLVAVVLQAVHEVLVDVMTSGGHAHAVRMQSDAEALHVVVRSGPGSPAGEDSPWLRLARTRLAGVGGDLVVQRRDDGQTTDITVPLQG